MDMIANWIIDRDAAQAALAENFLHGSGLEIGALHKPMPVPPDVKVSYIDRMVVVDLRRQYPELSGETIVETDIVADGQDLRIVPDASQDFVISSHVIEHMEDPIGAMKGYLRVLKAGGIVLMSVPDRRHCFDRDRPLTPFDHLVADHETGPERTRRQHFLEWAELVDGKRGEEIAEYADRIQRADYSIHFHVWETTSFLEFLHRAKVRYDLRFELNVFVQHGPDFSLVLRKH